MAHEEETIKNLQADEIEALSSIFGDEFKLHDDRSFSINICNSSGNEFHIQVVFPEMYPLHTPPKYEISAPWMSRTLKTNLYEELENICCHNKGDSIIYLLTDVIRDFIEKNSPCLQNKASVTHNHGDSDKENVTKATDEIPIITHGEIIKDRKSIFQAHHAKVTSLKQVTLVLEKLKENKKIASATHNIYAYRFKSDNNQTFIYDCNDDGEAKAGPVLLNLLEVLNLTDTLIVVTRWFGGIHLGSVRFKHINDAAKNLIDKLELVKEKVAKPSGSKSKST